MQQARRRFFRVLTLTFLHGAAIRTRNGVAGKVDRRLLAFESLIAFRPILIGLVLFAVLFGGMVAFCNHTVGSSHLELSGEQSDCHAPASQESSLRSTCSDTQAQPDVTAVSPNSRAKQTATPLPLFLSVPPSTDTAAAYWRALDDKPPSSEPCLTALATIILIV